MAQWQTPGGGTKEWNRLRAKRNPAADYEAFVKPYSIARTPRPVAQLGLCESPGLTRDLSLRPSAGRYSFGS